MHTILIVINFYEFAHYRNGDHIHTNFKDMYMYLRRNNYYVEVLGIYIIQYCAIIMVHYVINIAILKMKTNILVVLFVRVTFHLFQRIQLWYKLSLNYFSV